MHLCHRPVDAPAGAHLAPVQNVLLLDRSQFVHTVTSVITEIREQKYTSVKPCISLVFSEVRDDCRPDTMIAAVTDRSFYRLMSFKATGAAQTLTTENCELTTDN